MNKKVISKSEIKRIAVQKDITQEETKKFLESKDSEKETIKEDGGYCCGGNCGCK